MAATVSVSSLGSFDNNSFLNTDLVVGNKDGINNINKLLPFSTEITEKIISYAYYLDAPNVVPSNVNEVENLKINIPSSSNNLTRGRYSNLNNLQLVNSGFYLICLQYQYKYCKFIRSFNFSKFLFNLMSSNKLGNYVEFLDFQEFTAVGLGKSIESIYKIPNLTSFTFLQCLQLCSENLKTLLLSESVDNDINFEILDFIFNGLKKLKSLDFCGCSNDNLVKHFDNLIIDKNLNLEKLSFHECLSFPNSIYSKILPFTPNLKRLDLSHTQITLKALNEFLNKEIRLTHLSLRKCSHLGTFTEFIKFLKHPSICGFKSEGIEEEEYDDEEDHNEEEGQVSLKNKFNNNLRWLNIQQCFSSDTITSERLEYIIQIIGNGSPNLRYLNLNGYANLNGDHIRQIIENFKNLESLSICDVNLNFSEFSDLQIIHELNLLTKLKFLDLSNSLWSFEKLKNVLNAVENIEVIEVKPFLSDNLSHVFKINESFWRVYNNKGTSRRCWIHRIESLKDNVLYDNYETEEAGSKIIEWDINTGDLVLNKVKRVNWLGYADVKINCCEDVDYSLSDEDFGNNLCVRGLYKYYSLKV